METETTTGNYETTDISNNQGTNNTQAAAAFTQDDVNKIVADRIERERKKYEKRFEGVDPERYSQLLNAEETRRIEEMKKAGQFEEILKETAAKKDAYWQEQLQTEKQQKQSLLEKLKTIEVDNQMISIASQAKAINPQQVVQLLKNQVVYKDDGNIEITDGKGNLLTNAKGDVMSMEDLVNGFLQTNQHFLQASPAGTGTKSSQVKPVGPIDITKLNMRNPEDVKRYKEYRKQNGLA
jgi:hypothetical protein